MLHMFINEDMYQKLPKSYQAIVRQAAALSNTVMMARYDVVNPPALRRLAGAGAQLRPFSEPVLDACFNAANEVYAENSAKNADFKTVYENMKAFRAEAYLWQQFSEQNYDSYMMLQQRKKTL